MAIRALSGVPFVRSVLFLVAVLACAVAPGAADAQAPLSAALRVPRPEGGVPFGGALAGRAGKIAIGPGFANGGKVFVVDGTTGALLVTIPNPSAETDDRFGTAVAWVGDDVLVGAPLSDVAGVDHGIAYLFDGTTGALLQTLTRPDDIVGWFGYSVAGLGDDAVVGAQGPLPPGGKGAYLFDGATGSVLASFADPNYPTPAAGAFGRTVITSGGEVFVASSYGASAVYRFDASGTLLTTYADPDPLGAEEFGEALAVSGTHLAIGGGTDGDGTVYLYDIATGALEHTYAPPFFSDSLFFGQSVGGVPGGLAIGSNDGVFVYGVTPPYDLAQTLHPSYPDGDRRQVFGRELGALDDMLLVGAIDVAYAFDACGNGTRTAREQCDDGNLVDGDGCSGQCLLETCGAAPAAGCVAATVSSLQARDQNSLSGTKDSLKWTWSGPSTDLGTLGDPLSTTSLSLCVYDITNLTPRLRLQPAALAGGTCGGRPCWKIRGTTGIGYADKELTPSGIARVVLKTSPSGTKALVLGKGPDLGVVSELTGGVPLLGDVRVQLRSSTSPVCLEATYLMPAQVNTKGVFRDKTP